MNHKTMESFNAFLFILVTFFVGCTIAQFRIRDLCVMTFVLSVKM